MAAWRRRAESSDNGGYEYDETREIVDVNRLFSHDIGLALGEPSLRNVSTILGYTLTNVTDDADVRMLANKQAYWST